VDITKQVAFCDCGYPDHQLVFEVDETDDEYCRVTDKALILFVNVKHYNGFWKRLRNAYRYLTKSDVRRVDYMDVMVSDLTSLKSFRAVVDEVIEFNENKVVDKPAVS
jgi:hypothetical protein